MKKRASLVFTGDISFDRYMDGRWEDETLLSEEICGFLNSADHVVANVEGPLIRNQKNTSLCGTAQLMHTMDPDVTKVLAKMRADIWNICNNHIMDAGREGLECTRQEAKKLGVKTIGAGMDLQEAKQPVILAEAGGIGLFGVG